MPGSEAVYCMSENGEIYIGGEGLIAYLTNENPQFHAALNAISL